jgi:acid phosphatase type 7
LLNTRFSNLYVLILLVHFFIPTLSFVFLFTLSFGQVQITRGAYLQKGGSTSMVVKFFTNIPVVTKVKYGLSPTTLTNATTLNGPNLNHTFDITGLSPNTKYYYAIYKEDSLMQGSSEHYFITSQPIGSTAKLRVWITGDTGTGHPNQINVATQMENYIGANYLNAWILLGDNAYSYGSEIEFTSYFFQPYQAKRFMKQTVIWPSPGNHDYGGSLANQTSHNIPYFSIFSVPQAGEFGGVPSTVPQYYSYNINNVHFVSLDSYGLDSYGLDNGVRFWDTLASPQISWLRQDLAANTQKWTIIYFHHPPFTMGSHNSDTEPDLALIRQQVVPIFEKYKVDMVLCGHSHTYERSKPFKGYYGLENSFLQSFNTSSSTGRYDGSTDSCPYIRRPNSTSDGIIYAVVGSSGWPASGQVSFPHEALPIGNKTNSGSMILEFEDNRMDAKWISDVGILADKFTLIKAATKDTVISLGPVATSLTLTASPKTSYSWPSNNQTSQISTFLGVENGQVITATDNQGCFVDKFKIVKVPDCPMNKSQGTNFEAVSIIKMETSGSINSNKLIFANTKTKFDAGQSITLNPGFSVEKGAVFNAYIDGCGNLRKAAK